MAIADNLTGKIYGRLTVIERVGSTKNGHAIWDCKCSCGKRATVLATNLKRGHTISCGCANVECITKHGLWGSLTYQSWKGMIQRCTNPKASRYEDYGGRGITVCGRWLESFDNFLADMGERPRKSLTLDRIDNNKGYYKQNCRWATQSVQNYNRRKH